MNIIAFIFMLVAALAASFAGWRDRGGESYAYLIAGSLCFGWSALIIQFCTKSHSITF